MIYNSQMLSYAVQLVRHSPTVLLLGLAFSLANVPVSSYPVDSVWFPLTTLVLPLLVLLGTSRIEPALIIASDRAASGVKTSWQEAWAAGAPFTWRVFVLQIILFLVSYLVGLVPINAATSCFVLLFLLLWGVVVGTILDLSVRAVILHDQTVQDGFRQGLAMARAIAKIVLQVWIGILGRILLVYLMVGITFAVVLVAVVLVLNIIGDPIAVGDLQAIWNSVQADYPPLAWAVHWLVLSFSYWLPITWTSVVWTLFFRAATGPGPTQTPLENNNTAVLE